MKFSDIMLDLETLGTSSNSVIISIAAVAFDLKTGEIGPEFYTNIDIQSCLDIGLTVSGETIKWWFQQSEDARQALFDYPMSNYVKNLSEGPNDESYSIAPLHIDSALQKLSSFLYEFDIENLKIWGNGSSFDCGILNDAYDKVGIKEKPWRFWNERDVRTIADLNPSIKNSTQFIGTPHYALDDCKHQITYIHNTYKSLNL